MLEPEEMTEAVIAAAELSQLKKKMRTKKLAVQAGAYTVNDMKMKNDASQVDQIKEKKKPFSDFTG